MIKVVICASQLAASHPPWICDKCLRRMFTSAIGAPQWSSIPVIALKSSIGTPSTASASRLEPPPDTSASRRSSSVNCLAAARMRLAACTPAASGNGWPASTTVISPVGRPCA